MARQGGVGPGLADSSGATFKISLVDPEATARRSGRPAAPADLPRSPPPDRSVGLCRGMRLEVVVPLPKTPPLAPKAGVPGPRTPPASAVPQPTTPPDQPAQPAQWPKSAALVPHRRLEPRPPAFPPPAPAAASADGPARPMAGAPQVVSKPRPASRESSRPKSGTALPLPPPPPPRSTVGGALLKRRLPTPPKPPSAKPRSSLLVSKSSVYEREDPAEADDADAGPSSSGAATAITPTSVKWLNRAAVEKRTAIEKAKGRGRGTQIWKGAKSKGAKGPTTGGYYDAAIIFATYL